MTRMSDVDVDHGVAVAVGDKMPTIWLTILMPLVSGVTTIIGMTREMMVLALDIMTIVTMMGMTATSTTIIMTAITPPQSVLK